MSRDAWAVLYATVMYFLGMAIGFVLGAAWIS